MQTKKITSNGRLNDDAKQRITFNQLNREQREQVRMKANRYGTLERKRFERAYEEHREQLDVELRRLNDEPLTTGALFVVASTCLNLASHLLYQIGRIQTGDQSHLGEENEYGCNEFEPDAMLDQGWLNDLLKRYAGEDSDLYKADSKKSEAESLEEVAAVKLLDKTANEMFGNGEKEEKV